LKKVIAILLCMILPTLVSAESSVVKEITMTTTQAVQLAGTLFERGDLDRAEEILTKLPPLGRNDLEIERWFLLGQISARRGDYQTAITIYRRILADQPGLARIRFELAVCYMKTRQWYRADYHLHLAMAGDDLPEHAKQIMNHLRFVIRQNKNWNVWFNFGIAPDNNVNAGVGGEECVMTMFGLFCRQLPEPVKAVGYNFTLGGDYEFKLSDKWRWKSDGNIHATLYDQSQFDNLHLSASTGPRYVWNKGDIWLAAAGGRRLHGWDGYNRSYGARLLANYDFTRKLSGGLSLRFMQNVHDEFGELLDGETYGANTRISYAIDATKYVVLRTGLDRENTKDPIYAHWRPSASAGFGIELPARFHLYLDASAWWQNHDGKRWVVKDNSFSQVAERNFTHRYAASVSNNRFTVWNFAPALTFSYTKRESNIWQREFDRFMVDFSMRQRF